MDFKLTEEQEMLRKEVRRFAAEKLEPISFELDEMEETSFELMKLLKEEELFPLLFPVEYGGLGVSSVNICIVREEFSRVCIRADGMWVQQGLSSNPIVIYGTEEQKQKYLPPLARGEKLCSFCLTEPNAGSDVARLEMTARLDGDDYILNGTKSFISNPGVAEIYTVFAKTDPAAGARGITGFIVERDMPGFSAEKMHLILPSPIGMIHLDNCRVPRSNVLGEVGRGMRVALSNLNIYRTTVGAACVGMAQRAYEEAIRYAKSRIAFGQPLAEFQATQFKLADMLTQIEAARLLVYRAATLRDEGQEMVVKEASIAKLFASEMAQRVVDESLQIHGGIGICKGLKVEMLYRAVRAPRLYEGTSEIQRIVIARQILRDS